MRTAAINGQTLQLVGDTNQTTTIEVISAPKHVTSITWNGEKLHSASEANTRCLTGTVEYSAPKFHLSDLNKLDWKYADSLPEIKESYDDSKWTMANHPYTNNTQVRNLTTPTSLYSTDYGFNTGVLIYRTHFTANGKETKFGVETQGGSAFGASVWINDMFLGSWPGSPSNNSYFLNLTMPKLQSGKEYVITMLQDMMGLEESGPVGPGSLVAPTLTLLNTLRQN